MFTCAQILLKTKDVTWRDMWDLAAQDVFLRPCKWLTSSLPEDEDRDEFRTLQPSTVADRWKVYKRWVKSRHILKLSTGIHPCEPPGVSPGPMLTNYSFIQVELTFENQKNLISKEYPCVIPSGSKFEIAQDWVIKVWRHRGSYYLPDADDPSSPGLDLAVGKGWSRDYMHLFPMSKRNN